MRTFILMMVLAVVSSSAMAEWVEVLSGVGGTAYVDTATIRKVGDKVRMLQMIDFKAVQIVAGDKYMSIREEREYDCKEVQSRNLAYTSYTGNLGEGEVVWNSASLGEWSPTKPNTVLASLWNYACQKR
jgi:hypothetical protein